MTLSISTYKHKVETIKEAECILRDQHYMIRRNVRVISIGRQEMRRTVRVI